LTPVTNYFGVLCTVETQNRKEADLRELRLAGLLDLFETDQEGVETNKLEGAIYNWSSPSPYPDQKTTGMIKNDNNRWHFGTEKETFKLDRWDPNDPWPDLNLPYFFPFYDFYTLGDAPGLSLKAVVKIPAKMVSSSGSVKRVGFPGTLPFKSLLSKPDFSDVTLQCGHRIFSAHRILLANKSTVFERMLKADMTEAATGVVVIQDILSFLAFFCC